MQKITFENETNGLSASFATDTPLMFLESFDGCSCGSNAITYQPINFDGQRLISSNLNARTVQFTVNFGGRRSAAPNLGEKFSRKEAMKRWDEIQRVFVPGQAGTLTWTNGADSRFIRCRCSEMPKFTEILPYLFKASFSMIADKPLWYDSEENTLTITTGKFTVENPCGIAVPFTLEVTPSSDVFVLMNTTSSKGIAFSSSLRENFTIDTDECTVTTASGELVNYLLNVNSEFFNILPGTNSFNCVGWGALTMRWRKAYMGIG